MGAIHAVLLIPAEGDPLNLLKEGPCGARPPRAVWGCWDIAAPGMQYSWVPEPRDVYAGRRALVLAWDGQRFGAGVAYACGMDADVDPARGWPDEHAVAAQVFLLLRLTVPKLLAVAARDLTDLLRDVGTMVLLDAEGREVQP